MACLPRGCCLAGALVVHSYTDLQLHLYTVNGRHLASAGGLAAPLRLRCPDSPVGPPLPARQCLSLPGLCSLPRTAVCGTVSGGRVTPTWPSDPLPSPPLPGADTHERLACLCPTPNGRMLLAAGTSGLVTLRWMHSLQVGASSAAAAAKLPASCRRLPSNSPPSCSARPDPGACRWCCGLTAAVGPSHLWPSHPRTASWQVGKAGATASSRAAARSMQCARLELGAAPRPCAYPRPCRPCHAAAAGTAEGSVVLFAPDPRRRITRRLTVA